MSCMDLLHVCDNVQFAFPTLQVYRSRFGRFLPSFVTVSRSSADDLDLAFKHAMRPQDIIQDHQPFL